MDPVVQAALSLIISGAIQLAKQAGATADQVEKLFQEEKTKLLENDPAKLPDPE